MSSPPRIPERPEPTARRPRTFVCRDDLFAAFEARARELECSLDWLVAEAMKRLLRETGTGLPQDPAATLPVSPVRPVRPRMPLMPLAPLTPPPPPPPKRVRRPDLASPKPPPTAEGAIALRSGASRVVVAHDRFVIGRAARHAHLVVKDPGVSRQHAILERTREGWVLVDMASTNGVELNGARVTRAAVRPGDVIVVGPATIVVERA